MSVSSANLEASILGGVISSAGRLISTSSSFVSVSLGGLRVFSLRMCCFVICFGEGGVLVLGRPRFLGGDSTCGVAARFLRPTVSRNEYRLNNFFYQKKFIPATASLIYIYKKNIFWMLHGFTFHLHISRFCWWCIWSYKINHLRLSKNQILPPIH